jgi:hypothetical protein
MSELEVPLSGSDANSDINGSGGLLDLLACWEWIEDVFPDVDDGLLPLSDVTLDASPTD